MREINDWSSEREKILNFGKKERPPMVTPSWADPTVRADLGGWGQPPRVVPIGCLACFFLHLPCFPCVLYMYTFYFVHYACLIHHACMLNMPHLHAC